MQFFLARVEQGKDTVCAYLRASAVKENNLSFSEPDCHRFNFDF